MRSSSLSSSSCTWPSAFATASEAFKINARSSASSEERTFVKKLDVGVAVGEAHLSLDLIERERSPADPLVGCAEGFELGDLDRAVSDDDHRHHAPYRSQQPLGVIFSGARLHGRRLWLLLPERHGTSWLR